MKTIQTSISDTTTRQLKISVTISTYKRPDYLFRLLESIFQQEYNNYEIIIVDDSSPSSTQTIIADYIKSHSDKTILFSSNKTNMGTGLSKKIAYLQCSGDIIIFCDDDDYYTDNTYFSTLNKIYANNPDCIMTIAGTTAYYSARNEYVPLTINFSSKISNCEYFNGFTVEYVKPHSMFTMSLRASSAKSNNFSELSYFNDTSLYLFGLLADGMVYPINKSVGVYFVHENNMTGNVKAEYTIENLISKDNIYKRAISKGMLNNERKWYLHNIGATSDNHLKYNKRVNPEDKKVWQWIKEHYSAIEYYKYVASVFRYRIKNRLPINISYAIKPGKKTRKNKNG